MPVAARVDVVCDDDCENCPLYLEGCAQRCVRWDDLVCKDCPCLASLHAGELGEPVTVEPKTNQPAGPSEAVIAVRNRRRQQVSLPEHGI